MKFFLALIACLVCFHLSAPAAVGGETAMQSHGETQQLVSDAATVIGSASEAVHVSGGKIVPACGEHCHATAQSLPDTDGRAIAAPAIAGTHASRPATVTLLVPPPQ